MKKLIYIMVLVAGMAFVFNSCSKILDTTPIDPDQVTSAIVFDDPEAYAQFMAKCYAGLAVTGQEGPAGNGDVSVIDEGFSQYLRQYWYHQELTTDEAIITWDDATIKDFHFQEWGTDDRFIAGMYYRIFYQIALTNEFLRQTSNAKLDDRGVSQEWRDKIVYYRLEARWLRALSYWHALDLFGSVPFGTEEDPIGDFLPPQISKADLFVYIESELKAIEGLMMAPRSNEYGRADQAAAWTLLAKLYMNAEVYIGENKYSDCITYCDKVINSSYSIAPTFQQLFWANNDQVGETMQEIIFPIRYSGEHTQTWGGTTFVIHAGVGGDMVPGDYGIDGGWGGTRVTPELVGKYTGEDSRAMFFTDGQTLEIDNVADFQNGYALTKFRNMSYDETGTGTPGFSLTFPDTDFPLFRLGDVYLMYAEAAIRGGGGNMATAVGYVNELRARAEAIVIAEGDMTLDFILDERGRELCWEGHRRTDLIRHNKFTGGEYIWSWKGNTKDGRATDAKYNLFPLPASDVSANPNLTQNPNY